VTAEDQANWKIPPCISNWKNAKGYTIPLDKRLAADGRGLQVCLRVIVQLGWGWTACDSGQSVLVCCVHKPIEAAVVDCRPPVRAATSHADVHVLRLTNPVMYLLLLAVCVLVLRRSKPSATSLRG
jgi:hypothetical protein